MCSYSAPMAQCSLVPPRKGRLPPAAPDPDTWKVPTDQLPGPPWPLPHAAPVCSESRHSPGRPTLRRLLPPSECIWMRRRPKASCSGEGHCFSTRPQEPGVCVPVGHTCSTPSAAPHSRPTTGSSVFSSSLRQRPILLELLCWSLSQASSLERSQGSGHAWPGPSTGQAPLGPMA